jgi:uncharacterized protein (DUF2147 family)
MRAFLSLLLLVIILPTLALAAEPIGEWMVASKKAHIRIVDCAGTLWGVVSWQQNPGGLDDKNPDPAKRGRPTLGMPVLMDLRANGPNHWDGALYNSNNGKTYTGGITLIAPNLVRVRGCVLGFLCGGEDWTRVDETDNNSAAVTAICKAVDRPHS